MFNFTEKTAFLSSYIGSPTEIIKSDNCYSFFVLEEVKYQDVDDQVVHDVKNFIIHKKAIERFEELRNVWYKESVIVINQ